MKYVVRQYEGMSAEDVERRCLRHLTSEDRIDAHYRWNGDHRNVRYEICFWGAASMNDGNGIWNFYVILPEPMFPDNKFEEHIWLKAPEPDEKGRVFYSYYVWPFDSLKFHCGITYYHKSSGIDGETRVVKVGCDYAHAWDQDAQYDRRFVEHETKKCIDSLHDLFPGLRVRCAWSGMWHPSEESVINKNGDPVWREKVNNVPAEYKWFP